jgi:hypothetical protein
VSNWLVPQLGAVKVATLTPQTVTHLVDDLRSTPRGPRQAGLSTRSAQMAVGTLKAACAFAVETGLIGRNPVRGRPPTEIAASADDVMGHRAGPRLPRGDRG